MTPASRTGADARAEMPELGAAESASLRKSFLEALTLIALLADGHLLVEGAPGLAKTRAIKVLSDGVES